MSTDATTDATPSPSVPGKPRKRRAGVPARLAKLSDLDQRTRAAKRVSECREAMECDLGGADALSESQRSLIIQASLLAAFAESCGARWLEGGTADPDWLPAINALGRVVKVLGIKRVPKPALTLDAYIAAKRAAEAAEETP